MVDKDVHPWTSSPLVHPCTSKPAHWAGFFASGVLKKRYWPSSVCTVIVCHCGAGHNLILMGLIDRDTDLLRYDSVSFYHCGAGRNFILIGLIGRDTDLRQHDSVRFCHCGVGRNPCLFSYVLRYRPSSVWHGSSMSLWRRPQSYFHGVGRQRYWPTSVWPRDKDLLRYDSVTVCHCGSGCNLIFMGLINRDKGLLRYDTVIVCHCGAGRNPHSVCCNLRSALKNRMPQIIFI